ncbi:PorT family protein [Muricauda sp. SCSIO 64092]|uniref:porin family protein n=1 Tax=Allomuricauda sp. SCSIO 64092 TaxID=2908842 RepID=UPI001FF6868E|nr:porin family protein [Muricauda sp. SCSIO 64092]UOY07621.1 PorT family protein [Muricauda sp. SCSIO 64092]
MKNTFCITLALLLCLSSLNAQDFSFGAKAGANFSNLTGDDVENASSRTGFHIGAVAHIGISEKFGVQPELIYSQQGSVDDEFDITLKLDYLTLPILADVTLAEGLSLQAGPQFGFNINSSAEDSDGNEGEPEGINDLDIGVVLGAQYTLDSGLFFQARYGLGLSDITDDGDAQNSNISISIGYFFL